jgi:hypothetical protein
MKHFDHTHTTVAEARACEQGRGGVALATRPQVSQERTHTTPFYRQEPQAQATPAWAANPAHPNRVKYAGDLVRKYPTDTLTGEAAEAMMDLIDGKPMSAAEVDLLITNMQAIRTLVKAGTYRAPSMPTPAPLPQAEPTRAKADAWREWRTLAAQLEAVSSHPSGARFACATEGGSDNDLAFWWISKHERSGRYYLRQIIGGRGAVDTRLSPQAMITIAKKILAAGAYEAMILFGQSIGRCGHCGRMLTNQESREAGIGPICRGK